jgi:hypothetical protein
MAQLVYIPNKSLDGYIEDAKGNFHGPPPARKFSPSFLTWCTPSVLSFLVGA